ncbi:hypothetical protein Tco_1033310 [Tanacetum coccineum]|uniref:Uncharacterized protein n=1 Tax=Tanacetum coccineum TaxID=301880 RepID=A0ABQ5GF19_9ASTR
MTRGTAKKLTKPLDEPEREFRRRRRASWRQHQNESLAIAGRNLFDDEESCFINSGAEPSVPLKTLWENSLPSSASFQSFEVWAPFPAQPDFQKMCELVVYSVRGMYIPRIEKQKPYSSHQTLLEYSG